MNKVILVGRLGQDPEVRTTNSGSSVADFSIATDYRKKDGSEWVTETEWSKCVAFGKTAEIAGQYLTKGSQVAVEGRLRSESWTDKEGNKRKTVSVMVSELKMLGAKSKPSAPVNGHDDDIPF